jgi:predicted AlkP superfamily pyrophosphatase or phosphodiesterase
MIRMLLLVAACLAAWAQQPHPANAPAQADKPYVLLISLDGFRYDYAARDHASNLIEFGKHGVRAKALLPVFPTSTFPNHYSIATGLYPAHHGIVENSFWDPRRKALFRFNDPALASDPAWWGGTPLWVLAEEQGMRTAAYFWPGTDYEIQHTRPTYYHPYDAKATREQQVEAVIEWLRLPKPERPHFMTLYFPDVDHEGHLYGPDAPETHDAVMRVDRVLGKLFEAIRETGVPVNIFVVSDHGMATLSGVVDMTSFADLTGVVAAGAATDFKIYSNDRARLDSLYAAYHGRDPRFEAYRPDEIPARLDYSGNDRIGDIVVLAMKPVLLRGVMRPGVATPRPPRGMHGYDVVTHPEMRAIFYAQGPDLKSGLVIDEFENIHIYPLIAHILALKGPEGIDGRFSVLAPILRSARSLSH